MKLFSLKPRDIELLSVSAEPGQEFTLTVQSGDPFRGKWLLLDHPEWWDVLDIRIGVVPQKGPQPHPRNFSPSLPTTGSRSTSTSHRGGST